jgi:Bacterial Ig-like domain (group 1)
MVTVRSAKAKRAVLSAFTLVLLVAISLVGGGSAGASPPPAPTFNQNLLLPGSSGAGEPSIRTDQFGQSFVIGPTGVPAGCKAMRVRHDGSAATFLGFPDHTAGGGDCDWASGPQETANLPGFGPSTDSGLAYSSLTAANITVGKSNDGGNSFGPPNPGAAQVGGDDRMWQAADPQLNSGGFDTVFMSYHDVSVGNIEVSISVNGGQTYAQSTPLINSAEVPTAQWAGALAGNELGNIVARRPKGGSLTLYSIFQTPDSAADNINQGGAGTTNFNRVYEAVGTVTDVPYPGVPVVVWHDYEIYHGPLGARYNRIFPVTAVDAAGKVYAFWSDGNHTFTKSDLTGTGWNPSAAPSQIPTPTGVNTEIMPWAQAGASGIVDAVFYGATGGSGAQPNPQDDLNNHWNVYMAQTIDGGSSWTVSTASDHTIHTGPICIDGLACNTSMPARNRTLLDFFQVSIDPTNGAADIAYADDHAAPGNAVLYFTRQCTGVSATTGVALTSDCVAPPPPPPPPMGTTCPGPQVVDFTNDAPNNYPAGDGSNMDNLDIENAFFGTPDAGHIKVTLTIKNLSAPPPPVNMISAFWTVYWTFGGKTYFAQATSNGQGPTAVYTFSDGTFANGSFTPIGTPTGTVMPGPNGTIVMTVPRADVGGPANGATLTNPFADTHGSFTVAGTGVYYTAAADRAPDSNYGANYVVGQTCLQPPPPGTPTSLTLAPKTETDNVFTTASETATVKDANGNPVPGVVVRFTVTGANPTSGSQTTDQFGQATFSYTGQNTGVDTIKAFADTNNNGSQDAGEPSDTATKTWVTQVTTPGCTVKITNGGTIVAANGDQGSFGGNAQASSSGSSSGQEQYQDHGPKQPLNAHSIDVSSVTCNAQQTQATIEGHATINGSGSYTFQIIVQDNGSGGSSDAYGIRLSNGYNSGVQPLSGGNVDIHKQ